MTEMPREIWAYRNKYCHENFGRLWSDDEHINPCTKYIRADLAEKPAPDDAEVREAIDYFYNLVDKGYLTSKGIAEHIQILIRAAQSQNKNGDAK